MNPTLRLATAASAFAFLCASAIAEDSQQPSEAVRHAVAVIHAAGGSLTIDADFCVVSVTFGNYVVPNDDDLEQLTSLPHLERLTFPEVTVTDKTLATLMQLKSLRSLVLRPTTVSPQQEAQLRSALPDCEIKILGGFSLGREPSMLINHPVVQADLQLTDKQRKQFQELIGTTSREQREDDEVYEVLTDEQDTRWSQIRLQVERVSSAIRRPTVSAVLNLSDLQWQTILRLFAENAEGKRELDDSLAPSERLSGEETLRVQMEKAILDVFTDEQRARWREMLGPPLSRKRP